MKISTILHRAADKYLISCFADYTNPRMNCYSCIAIEEALEDFYEADSDEFKKWLDKIHIGLREMGCDVKSSALFLEYGDWLSVNPEVQGMRYFWLKWAALMAEEQGV
jgi:hypothetical protein